MKENKICSFFGHRTITVTPSLYATLTAEIMKSVDLGCRVFYFGGFGEFDGLCYQIVTQLQKENSKLGLKRIYCVPMERDLKKTSRNFPKETYEEVIYLMPSFHGWYQSIYFRNCAMIDDSDCILFYVEQRENSGAYKAYCYAQKKKGKRIVNVFPEQ